MPAASRLAISDDLERSLLAGLIRGVVGADLVPTASLSKLGKVVYDTVVRLDKAELDYDALVLAGTSIFGAEKRELAPYVSSVLAKSGAGTNEILKSLEERQALSDVSNEVCRQLAEHVFDPSAFAPLLAPKQAAKLEPASTLLKTGKLPAIPSGYPISLPSLQKASGGVFGLWAIGGEAKLGKSTLGLQLALEAPGPVLYYDMENGPEVMLYRIGEMYGGNVDLVRTKTQNLYFRRHIRTLASDLASVSEPCLIVVDSLQALPVKMEERRSGIDGWLQRFERLKEDGHATILISEVNALGGYKESGDIVYKVDFGMTLQWQDRDVVASIVANRHRPYRGPLCTLVRENWRFEEQDQALSGEYLDL